MKAQLVLTILIVLFSNAVFCQSNEAEARKKGQEAIRAEDRLLAYWVSIEHVFTREIDHSQVFEKGPHGWSTANVIREIVPAIHLVRAYPS